MVESPEMHRLTVTNKIPVIEAVEERRDFELTATHTIERCSVEHKWTKEEVEIEVPSTTIQEVALPRFVEVAERIANHQVVEDRYVLPQSRTLLAPQISVNEQVHHAVNVECRTQSHTAEVLHVVDIPQFDVVQKREVREVVGRTVVVPHVERYERLVEIDREIREEVDVEVPQLHRTRTIRQVVDGGQAELVPNSQQRQSLRSVRAYAAELARETESFRVRSSVSVGTYAPGRLV